MENPIQPPVNHRSFYVLRGMVMNKLVMYKKRRFQMVILPINMVLCGLHRLNQVPNVIGVEFGDDCLGIDDGGGGVFTRICGNNVVGGRDMVDLIGKMSGDWP